MIKKVVLFVIQGRDESTEAEKILETQLSDFEQEIVFCPSSMEDKFLMPFIRHGTHPYYGLSGIRAFANEQHAIA